MKTNSPRPNTTPEGFAIGTTETLAPNHLRLRLQGHLDANGAPKLSDTLTELLADGRIVELDFEQVDFVSSMGIGTLIAAVGEYRDVGGDIVVMKLSAGLREVFETLDLLNYVKVQ